MNNLSHKTQASTYLSLASSALLMGAGYFLFNDSRAPYLDIQGGKVIAQLESITNKVKLKPSGELLWAEAWQGQPIPKNTLLFADKDSQAVISYIDGSKLILMPGSVVEIVTNDKGKFEFSVKKGKALSVPKASDEKPVLRSEKVEDVMNPLVYIVNTLKQINIEPGQTLIPTIRWEWTSEPKPSQSLLIQVTGENYDFKKELDLRQREEQLSIPEAGVYHWFLYLDDELMGGGTIEKKALSSPLVHFPQGTVEVDDDSDVALGWIYQGLVEKFELEVVFSDGQQVYEVDGQERQFIVPLPRNVQLNWRVRAIKNGFKGEWSEKGLLLLLSRQQNLLKKLEEGVSNLDEEFFVDDLPFNFQIRTSGLENFEIRVEGAQKVGEDTFKFSQPGAYTVEVRDPKSSLSIKKRIQLRLKDIQEHPEIIEGQKIKI